MRDSDGTDLNGCGSSGVTVSVPVGGRDLGDGSGVGLGRVRGVIGALGP
jgi:hypothetical protein